MGTAGPKGTGGVGSPPQGGAASESSPPPGSCEATVGGRASGSRQVSLVLHNFREPNLTEPSVSHRARARLQLVPRTSQGSQ